MKCIFIFIECRIFTNENIDDCISFRWTVLIIIAVSSHWIPVYMIGIHTKVNASLPALIEPPWPFRCRRFTNPIPTKCFRTFYCTVVPTVISNPFLRIFFEALTSRSWWALQCGKSPFQYYYLSYSCQCFHFSHCIRCRFVWMKKCLGTLMNSTPSRWHFYSNLSRKIRGAFNCAFLLKRLLHCHEIIFSFWTAIKEHFLTIYIIIFIVIVLSFVLLVFGTIFLLVSVFL